MSLDLKTCIACKESKPTSDYYWHSTKQAFYARCKVCFRKTLKPKPRPSKPRKMTKSLLESLRKASERSRKKFPEKWDARSKLRYAVKLGRIIKPKNCEHCQEEKSLQGHHEDYSKPFDVMWLCTKCHAKRHAYLKSIKLD